MIFDSLNGAKLYRIKESGGEVHWVIARSHGEVVTILASYFDFSVDDYIREEQPSVTELPNDEVIEVFHDDWRGDLRMSTIRTAGEWVQKNSAGLLASTLFL